MSKNPGRTLDVDVGIAVGTDLIGVSEFDLTGVGVLVGVGTFVGVGVRVGVGVFVGVEVGVDVGGGASTEVSLVEPLESCERRIKDPPPSGLRPRVWGNVGAVFSGPSIPKLT